MSELVSVQVPTVGESITEVQIGQWLKNIGDAVSEGEDLVEIETEKASVQVPSPATGTLREISAESDQFANVGDVIATIDPSGGGAAAGGTAETGSRTSESGGDAGRSGSTDGSPPQASDPTSDQTAAQSRPTPAAGGNESSDRSVTVLPAAQRLLDEHGLSAADVKATGPGNRLLKEDVQSHLATHPAAPPSQPQSPAARQTPGAQSSPPQSKPTEQGLSTTPPQRAATGSLVTDAPPHRAEEIKSMSMLRRTIANRLVEAQQNAALLTTFNEIDMAPVMAIRKKYKDAFGEKHGVKLGFMSFFAKASVEALRRFPAINAEIRDGNFVYRHYHDIGIAIGGGKGLVVPILRNVESMSFADVERSIGDYAKLAGENRLQPEDLMGGTFTISNGGVYGSLLSTPIVNPPQSGILGLHTIQERPVAVDGQVVIRPMMYIALTYDHRIVDGREAVGFLKTIKEVIEDPSRLFLEI